MENMKIIVENGTNASVHCHGSDQVVQLTEQGFVVDGVSYEPNEINASTAILVENIFVPDDWYGRKYVYQSGQWVLNPNDPMLASSNNNTE